VSGAEDRALFATLAALLGTGRTLDALSRCVTAAVLLALLLAPGGGVLLVLSLLLGVAQTYLAVRVSFDARLFAALAEAHALADLAAMDGALLGMKLMPPDKAGRPASQRAEGARRLLRVQAILLALQLLAALGAVLEQIPIGRIRPIG
jgi:hypothetical protein